MPTLGDVRETKLSKHVVVEESLAYHREQQAYREELERTLQAVIAEREFFLTELNEWRQCLGMPPRQPGFVHAPLEHEPAAGGLESVPTVAQEPVTVFDPYQVYQASLAEGAPALASGSSFIPDTLNHHAMTLPDEIALVEAFDAGVRYDARVRHQATEDWSLGLNLSLIHI